jgi:mannose-6-phosphate isomerase-like protein (cupin superfamily)
MKKYSLENFTKGWFIGMFDNSILKLDNFEVAIKRYKAGDKEQKHFHKIATEYTVIIEGSVLMNNERYKINDIIEITPNESTDFICIEDTTTCVIKIPSCPNDKFTEVL